jgi:hypothetical protein
MTSNQSSDRLDRIERVLDNLSANLAEERERRLELRQDLDGEADRWAETIRIVESTTRLAESNARLIESNARSIESNSASIAEQREAWVETRQIVEGNARAIAEQREAWAETRQSVDDHGMSIVEIRQLTESNARAIAEQRAAWSETRQSVDDHGMSIVEIRQLTESNARAIAANSDTAARQGEEMRASITDLVSMIITQADQAEIDRAEFRATVQQILEVLTQRFTSNGH